MANQYLYLFQDDLRTDDLPVLKKFVTLSEHEPESRLQCLYVLNPSDLKLDYLRMPLMGPAKLAMINEALADLAKALAQLNIPLTIHIGERKSLVSSFIKDHNITDIGVSVPVGYYESQSIQFLSALDVTVHKQFQTTLFDVTDLPIEIDELPNSFSKFRKVIEAEPLDEIFVRKSNNLSSLINPSTFSNKSVEDVTLYNKEQIHKYLSTPILKPASDLLKSPLFECKSGAFNAETHFHHYFSLTSPSTYKETRNFLENWSASTKASPFLATGSLSAITLWNLVSKYEKNEVKNESTYWIKFELLWREYFQWYAVKYRQRLFLPSGIHDTPTLTSFYAERFYKWSNGLTPSNFINAIMNQLNQTNYISNRARQITASYFVNELELDWRYGAAYFQMILADFDVASNWGNWQYLAGVGCDPRGKRKFNIDKQQSIYDPNGSFTQKWQGQGGSAVLDSVDMADWPQNG